MRYFLLIPALLLLASCQKEEAVVEAESANETVVLLHGLARSASSMDEMEQALAEAGYATCNIAYPSTHHSIAELAEAHVLPAMQACGQADTVHVVTHSMGGIVVRYLRAQGHLDAVGRVVMLSPPNQGSELVDAMGDLWLFGAVNGPAGFELGTDDASVPVQLGPVDFELGVITGDRSLNPLYSHMIEGPDDGKVSVERAQVEGMRDFLVLPASHTFIMNKEETMRQSLYFLAHGHFDQAE